MATSRNTFTQLGSCQCKPTTAFLRFHPRCQPVGRFYLNPHWVSPSLVIVQLSVFSGTPLQIHRYISSFHHSLNQVKLTAKTGDCRPGPNTPEFFLSMNIWMVWEKKEKKNSVSFKNRYRMTVNLECQLHQIKK